MKSSRPRVVVLMGSGSWETIPFLSGRPDWAPVLFRQGVQGCRVSGHRAVCMANLLNDAHANIYGSSIQQRYTLDSADGEPFLSTWKGYIGAGASTPVRGERSRPWPATEAAKAGASEGGNGSRSKPEQLFFVLNGHQSSVQHAVASHAGCHHAAGVPSTRLRQKKPCLEAVSLGLF